MSFGSKMKRVIIPICLIIFIGCSGSKYLTETGYLGIPNQERYPGKSEPISVARNKYFEISEVQLVPFEDYLRYKSTKHVKFVARHGDNIYFCTEFEVDLEIEPGVREWVILLERKKTVVQTDTEQTH